MHFLIQCNIILNQVFSSATTTSIVSSVAQFLRACTPLTPSWPTSYTTMRGWGWVWGGGLIKIYFFPLSKTFTRHRLLGAQ